LVVVKVGRYGEIWGDMEEIWGDISTLVVVKVGGRSPLATP